MRLPGLSTSLPFRHGISGLAIPKNLRITSTTATTISYAWDASAGVDGYQFGIYEDASCTVLIELITIYGASTTTYTWDMTYFQLSTNYFGRVIANGDSSITGAQRTIFYPKFKALVAIGATPTNVDRLFADKYCYTATQALTPWIWNGAGTGLATAVGSPTFTAGVGWQQNGSGTGYINTQWRVGIDNIAYTLNNAGLYQGITGLDVNQYVVASGSYSRVGGRYMSAVTCEMGITRIYTGLNMYGLLGLSLPAITFNTVQIIRNNSTNFVLKRDTTTDTVTAVSENIPLFSMFRMANNFDAASPDGIANIGTTDKWFCAGNSTLDKDLIETALAS